MANSRIDANDKGTVIVWNDDLGIVDDLYVDPVTGALLVYLETIDANTPTTLNNARIDANDNSTLLGYNETTGLAEALRCGTSGYLLVTQ